ncbi:MAG TPA: glycosyltransferase family 87 protein [Alphaproteobacteria bacterium]
MLGAPRQAAEQPHWLSLERLRIYPRIFIAVYVIMAVAWVLMSADLVDPKGKPLGYDFITFWAASYLALAGEAAAAFDVTRIVAVEQMAVPGSPAVFLWHYPPPFHLIVLPFALMPYLVAYAAWVASTLAASAGVIRRFAPRPETLALVLAFPGTFVNAFHGQNGFLSTALFGAALLLLPARPVAAGVMFGLLCYKPQLGLLVPLALLCGRQWVALASAAATALAFAGLSTVATGWDAWAAFFRNLPTVRLLLDDAMLPWAKIPSVYVGLRMLGFGVTPAYVVHGAVAVLVAATVARVWWLRAPLRLSAAVLSAGAVLIPPYLFDYDLALLAIPLAILAWDGLSRGWRSGEREILVLAWLVPMTAPIIAMPTGINVAAPCLGALFIVAVRRALAAIPESRGEVALPRGQAVPVLPAAKPGL